MNPIYLDHNATSPVLPEVAAAMAECFAAGYANPASQHSAGRRARQRLEDAREGIAEILGADLQSSQPDTLVFTSGGTEANNLAISGLTGRLPGHLAISAIEHPSVFEPAKELGERGWDVSILAVNSHGVVNLTALARVLEKPVQLVSVMLGNHETGVLQPIPELARACREADVPLHTDAIAAVGKIPVNFRRLGVAALSIAAHKFQGPLGIGALLLRWGRTPRPMLFGGFQQTSIRPGTECTALAVGMYEALRIWRAEWEDHLKRLTALRNQLETALRRGWPELVVHSCEVERLPHTLGIAFPGLNRQALIMALDAADIACSSGSACASGSTDPSPALAAMGCGEAILESSLRFSLSTTTSTEEVNEAAHRILRVCNHLRSKTPAGKMPITSPNSA